MNIILTKYYNGTFKPNYCVELSVIMSYTKVFIPNKQMMSNDHELVNQKLNQWTITEGTHRQII